MGTVIDHLSADHHLRVLQDFTDARGARHRAGEQGILRRMDVDFLKQEFLLEWERNNAKETLYFSLKATTGPRNGKMREFFELGDYAPIPRPAPPARPSGMRVMIENPSEPSYGTQPDWWNKAMALEDDGKLKEAEDAILKAVQHIGGPASVAEMYAQRMRKFQRAGDEARAIEAFKQASNWISYYASCATSGGEGAALSLERDEFRAGLVQQFGYDPEEKE